MAGSTVGSSAGAVEMASLLGGYSAVASSSVGSSVVASSSVGSSEGAGSSVGSSASHGMGWTPDSCTWVPSSSSVMGTSGVYTGLGAQVHPSGSSSWGVAPSQDNITPEGHIRFNHLPQFLDTPCQKVWSAQHWQISLLHPILEGPCICQGILRLSFSKILAGEHQVLRWQEFLLADAFGGWWCWIVIVDILGFAPCSEDFKRGSYLLSKLLEVIYPWDSHQLPPPVRCVDPTSPPHNTLFILFCQGLLQGITPLSLFLCGNWLPQEALDVQLQLWWGPQIEVCRGMPSCLVFFRHEFQVPEGDLLMWSSWTMSRGPDLAAFTQWSPPVPLALPLGSSSWLVLALGMVADIWPCPSSWPTESLYLLL